MLALPSILRAAFSPCYSCALPPQHLFPMEKYRRVHERLLADGTLVEASILAAGPVAEEDLRRVHSGDYVARFLAGELTAAEERRLGFSWSPGLRDRALHATQGTLLAARRALRDGIAANLAGGSHHAFPGHGEGYCAFHDMAVAIRALQAAGPARRVAIVDCDVHQGNGSAAILGNDPDVFTFSIHCESNYPVRKVPGSRDVGLRDGIQNAEYLAVLAAELDALWRGFRPQFVFYQAGVDPLAGDRLGRLRLSRAGLRRRDMLVLHRCLATDVPVVVVLGGGYAATLDETVEAHAETIRVAASLLLDAGGPVANRNRELADAPQSG